MIEAGQDVKSSLILEARRINDLSPAEAVRLMEARFGPLEGRAVALLGTAYRFNSEDTRNSPSLALAQLLIKKRCEVRLHDPYVKQNDQNLAKFGLEGIFSNDLDEALGSAEYVVFCTAHGSYSEEKEKIIGAAPHLRGVFDGCHLLGKAESGSDTIQYAGIGNGRKRPPSDLVDLVHLGFLCMERGFANEINELVDFLNGRQGTDRFNTIDYREVQRLAATCATGCDIADPGPVPDYPLERGFFSGLVEKAIRPRGR
jgi:hypothetical protein